MISNEGPVVFLFGETNGLNRIGYLKEILVAMVCYAHIRRKHVRLKHVKSRSHYTPIFPESVIGD